jgi:hypothetical protein
MLPSNSILYEENVLESNTISPSSVGLTIIAELGLSLALSSISLTNSLSIILSSTNLNKFFKGILSNSG